MKTLLQSIKSPAQLRTMAMQHMEQLATEIRRVIIENVADRGGHIAPNLGVVELTLALHRVFNTPQDLLVWDIGHQAYAHKLVTGRQDFFHTIRQLDGLSGYLRRDESPYDVFGASHASTSLSAALGLAVARDLRQQQHHVVAIIGDGSLTGGMALEAINNAGSLNKNLIIVINDNEKSISENVGALHSYMKRVRRAHVSTGYQRLREWTRESLERLPVAGEKVLEVVEDTEASLKQMFSHNKSEVIFKELGFKFYGPFDGHDIPLLIDVFENVKQVEGPIIIQVVTVKGKGWEIAENDSTKWHGPGPYDHVTGTLKKNVGDPPTFTQVFATTLVALAEQDPRIVGITAAMAEGTGLKKLQQQLPERCFDVGIAEQHAVTFAGGLAIGGFFPVVAIYSTFLQRAYDQIVHDICVQNLHVVFAIDRAGIVGEDGQTQHGVFDIGYLRLIPNMKLMAPKDEEELRHMLYTSIYLDGPVALRYPRGNGIGIAITDDLRQLEVGKAELMHPETLEEAEEASCTILAYGPPVYLALQAAKELMDEGIAVSVVNARWAKPLDEALILRLARQTRCIVTLEDHTITSGFGSAVLELLEKYYMLNIQFHRIGISDAFVVHGPATFLKEQQGLSVCNIKEVVRSMVQVAEKSDLSRLILG